MHIVKSLKEAWERHCCLDNKIFYSLNCFLSRTICLQSSFDYCKLLISYGRFHNLLTDMQIWLRNKVRRFRQSFDDRPYFGEPLLVLFYTSSNADISETRKDIKKRSTVFFPVFPVFSYQRIKFSFRIHFNPNLCGGGKFAPGSFFATAQKRLALDC